MSKNKIVCLLALSTLVFSSCKKEETTEQKIIVPTAANPEVKRSQPIIQQPTKEKIVPVSSQKPTEMVFTEEIHDFGTIDQGDKVMHVFTFKNTGKNDLIITRAVGSCGCTVPEYPKEPIAPGKTGKMKVSFNSTGKTGPQEKSVTISANVPNGAQVIKIRANVNK